MRLKPVLFGVRCQMPGLTNLVLILLFYILPAFVANFVYSCVEMYREKGHMLLFIYLSICLSIYLTLIPTNWLCRMTHESRQAKPAFVANKAVTTVHSNTLKHINPYNKVTGCLFVSISGKQTVTTVHSNTLKHINPYNKVTECLVCLSVCLNTKIKEQSGHHSTLQNSKIQK